jgi:hypothetical protein
LPAHAKRHAKLKAALKKLSRERPELEAPLARVLAGRLERDPLSLEQASLNEEAVYCSLLRSLPFEARLNLLREGRELAQRSGALSKEAKKQVRRFHRTAIVKRHLSLPSFW